MSDDSVSIGCTRAAVITFYLIHLSEVVDKPEDNGEGMVDDGVPDESTENAGAHDDPDPDARPQTDEPEGNEEGIPDCQTEDADQGTNADSEPLSPTTFWPYPTLLELLEHIDRLSLPRRWGVRDMELIRALEDVYRFPFLNDSLELTDGEPEDTDDDAGS